MQSGTKRASKPHRLLSVVLLSVLSVVPRSQAQGIDVTVLPPPSPQAFFGFGEAVSLSADGQTALVSEQTLGQPVVHVFVRNAGGWSLEANLSGNPGAVAFGGVVALSADGTVALVSDVSENCPDLPVPPSTPCGAVYIFARTGGGWMLLQHLVRPSFVDLEFYFGTSLALSADGSTVLVGRPSDDCLHHCSGAIFVYERSGSTWSLTATLRGSDPAVEGLGIDISLSPDGNTALAGAPFTPCAGGSDCGEAYVFTRNGGGWSEQARLTAFDTGAAAFFGTSVGLSADGTVALVGAPGIYSSPLGGPPGSVYPFARSGNVWIGTQKITEGISGDGFGRFLDLAANGESALAGAPSIGCTASQSCGAAYRLTRLPNGLWASSPPLVGLQGFADGGSLAALSGDGNIGLVGAPRTPCPAGDSCGAVYVFSGLAATIDVPALGGPGLAILTLALIAAALIFLRRRRSL